MTARAIDLSQFTLEPLESRLLPSMTVQFDYSLDASGFFSDPLHKQVLEEAASDLVSRLQDTLTAITPDAANTWEARFSNPATGAQELKSNLTVAADTLLIFVGGRELGTNASGDTILARGAPGVVTTASGSNFWLELVRARGELGALASTPTDFGPWGGSLVFDTDTNWYFGTDGAVPADRLDFYSTVQHELGHALGYGTAPSWTAAISGSTFTGAASKALFGGAVPLATGNAHWSTAIAGEQLMDPSNSEGVTEPITPLDLVGFEDIGWELDPPTRLPDTTLVTATREVTITIPTVDENGTPDNGIADHGDWFAKVFFSNENGAFQLSGTNTVDGELIHPGWTFTTNVPADQTSINVRIQLWDSDEGPIININGANDLADIDPTANDKNLDITIDLVNGRVTGDVSGRFFGAITASGDLDDGDGRAHLTFRVDAVTKLSQSLRVASGALTIHGDQFADLNDTVIIDRAAAGGLKVTINGLVEEYAPGEITSIEALTGDGSNSVTVLAAVAPITVHGAGLDRIVLGSGLPAALYTSDASGRSGYGTLDVGGTPITMHSIEYVDKVAPDLGNVQFDSVTIDENGVATLRGSFKDPGSYATHSVSVDWGDGTTVVPVALSVGDRSFVLSHRYLDDNPSGTASDNYTVTATVKDNDDQTDSATTTITVNNVRPQLTDIVVTSVIDENGTVTLSGKIVDPGTQDTYTLVLNWGDGTLPETITYAAGTQTFTVTHQYLDDNPTGTPQDINTVSLTLSDDDIGQGTASAQTLVKNVAPVIVTLSTSSTSADPAKEGAPVTIQGTFTDVGSRDTHTVTVDWGDGVIESATVTETNGSGSFVSQQHQFTSGGIYPVLITVKDDDTGAVSKTKAVFITGVGIHVVDGLTSLQVVGTNQADNITINQLGNGQITVHANFLPGGQRTLSSTGLDIMQVVALGGDDRVTVAGNVTLPAVIDGGVGNDSLNAGNGGAVLVGGAGNDSLLAGNGYDIMIGGTGADNLGSNGNGDILINGTTSYDSGADDDKLANDIKLLKIRAEWNASGTFSQRVSNLENGAGSLAGTGLSLKQGVTVFDDVSTDTLNGASGTDWFFIDMVRDQLRGRNV